MGHCGGDRTCCSRGGMVRKRMVGMRVLDRGFFSLTKNIEI